jgi:HK97 gp10 family phage protein
MSVSIVVTGITELDMKLANLPEKTQKKFARSALSQGMTIIRKAAIKAAPRGPTGNLRKSIKSRFKRIKQLGITQAKVGLNVGKRRDTDKTVAPHAHLVALGTVERFNKSGASRGVMPANSFFRRATDSVHSQVEKKMADILLKKVTEEGNR